ncbi:hypothetical protein ASPZODRAFT_135602 [Penicilliopsis zonata CBS 506.65]|uniref:Velvet domain-containing protein n=1 Tax=Penicilliopsis zonata CBS 506.65 TaxID=1073090 RepID=A0A1L9SAF2_9EURO|nr:hypothetical protein ASPZODRAFT_135602 [Penicilliopsis zonata CBS 506.65]OJJ44128.1 hypothetical protein ASPZODRAFT_135602 [Penicilliopsis zonata CBS 506.65]
MSETPVARREPPTSQRILYVESANSQHTHRLQPRLAEDDSPPCQTQELPRFLYPDNQGYDPTMVSKPTSYGFLSHKSPHDGVTDSRYGISSGSTVSLASQAAVQRANPTVSQPYIANSMGYRGYPAAFNEASNSSFTFTDPGRSGDAGNSDRRTQDVDSQSVKNFPSPSYSDLSNTTYSGSVTLSKPPQPPVNHGVPQGFDKILHHNADISPVRQTQASPSSRYHLHVRQHPSGARACGAGDRDRRSVDPPPIVQMLLTDFDPSLPDDWDILQDPRFTVGCLLYPVMDPSSPRNGDTEMASWGRSPVGSVDTSRSEDNDSQGQSSQLLSGKAFVSPFFVDDDPDPSTAPAHPSSYAQPPHAMSAAAAAGPLFGNNAKQPATFFIFSDLSVRTAGLYKLQFRLMNWGNVEDTGQSMPILAETWSNPFRVYPAKDFPGMQDSSVLAEGLKELGFVELKTRGKGKGKGRRR